MWTVALQMVLLFLFTAIVISPLLSLFFIKSGYWVSYLGINIFFFVVIIVLLMPIFMWLYQTDTLPRIEKMDAKYEEMKDTLPKGNSNEKILATT